MYDIVIHRDGGVELNNDVLGYAGENNARVLNVRHPILNGAEYSFVLRYDAETSYQQPITDGVFIPCGSLLIPGTVDMQFLAMTRNDDGEYILKSETFKMKVANSIEESPKPVPPYEVVTSALDELKDIKADITDKVSNVNQAMQSIANSAQIAVGASQEANTIADTIKNLDLIDEITAESLIATRIKALTGNVNTYDTLEKIEKHIAKHETEYMLLRDAVNGKALNVDVKNISERVRKAEASLNDVRYILNALSGVGDLHEAVESIIDELEDTTLKSYVETQTDERFTQCIDALNIGTRNWLLNTASPLSVSKTAASDWNVTAYPFYDVTKKNLYLSAPCVISFIVSGTVANVQNLRLEFAYGSKKIYEFENKTYVNERVTVKTTLPFFSDNQGNIGLIRFAGSSGETYDNLVISHMKLEAGYIPSDWAPAPEDAKNVKYAEGNVSRGSIPAINLGFTPLFISFNGNPMTASAVGQIVDVKNEEGYECGCVTINESGFGGGDGDGCSTASSYVAIGF